MATMAADLDAALDDVMIRSVEKLDSIISLRSQLNQYMETGMIDLARARYATGGPRSAISSLSFNLGHMEATKRVSCQPARLDYLADASELLKDKNVTTNFHLEQQRGDEENKPNAEPNLRHRQPSSMASSVERDSLESDNVKSDASLDATPEDQDASKRNVSSISGYSSDGSRRSSKTNDPLRWFGVLVPASLRSSKQCFDRALEILAEVASQQNELAKLLDHLQQLQSLRGISNEL